MHTALQFAIARSISHNEIVTVEVANADSALEALHEMGHIHDCVVVGDHVDVWDDSHDEQGVMDWRLRLVADYDAIARASIEGWSQDSDEHRRLADGFVVFAWDMRTEALGALGDTEIAAGAGNAEERAELLDGIVRDLVDLVDPVDQVKTGGFRLDYDSLESAFYALLDSQRAVLVTALRESVSE